MGRQQPAGSAVSHAAQQLGDRRDLHTHDAAAALDGAQATRQKAHAHDAAGDRHHHLHADQVTSVSLRLSKPLDLQRCVLSGTSVWSL
jgi:hypothetical protein